SMPEYYDLGPYRRAISTASPEAQVWFDRGLNWTYAFNHDEAVRCFERAIAVDPECAMAHWGIAYAGGPNYNLEWGMYDPRSLARVVATCHAAARRAGELAAATTPVEQALIEAIQARYPADTPADDCTAWNDAYADAMRSVWREFGNDLDVATLFADALMNRTPWQLWDLEAGEPAEGADTVEAREVLERALESSASHTHPGVLHMYIHLMEMSPYPERALRAADRLRDLVPDGGHLRHMPTHIDVLCGHYHDVVASNSAAIEADERYREREGAMNLYTLYRIHDYHFKLYGAMLLGQRELALQTADELVASIPAELLRRQDPFDMADRLESFIGMKLHALVRFGCWQEIIDTPLPEDSVLFCVTTALVHYARGVAFAVLGRVEEAGDARRRFEEAVRAVPETRYQFNNRSIDLLAIAREMLAGELEYRKANYDAAFSHLRQAVALDDGLAYDEPWGWMQPARHALGALLLEQGRIEEAEAVYRADLGLDGTLARAYQHPNNVWSLHGYHECVMRLGKHDLCGMISQRLEIAAARADVPIASSCFCRTTTAA
ncbi:MAG TPA: tetratricopeptide repeat protein, partial [Thermomicrobiaceae bacterium]|nr:tetratricopeptide repeat protein [Thermomicrobiaceae bacterium]